VTAAKQQLEKSNVGNYSKSIGLNLEGYVERMKRGSLSEASV